MKTTKRTTPQTNARPVCMECDRPFNAHQPWCSNASAPVVRADPPPPTPGFAIALEEDTSLGDFGILLLEDEDGRTEPVGLASTIGEGRQIAASNLAGKRAKLDRGQDAGLCPWVYILWARGINGNFAIAFRYLAEKL